jgi:thioredoxin-like negative regulator of GroEL
LDLIKLSEENFDQEVAQVSGTVVIDVYGPQCPECQPLLATFRTLADDYAGRAKFVELDSVPGRKVCIRLKVRGVPAVLIFRDGQEVGRLGAGLNAAALPAKLSEALAGL